MSAAASTDPDFIRVTDLYKQIGEQRVLRGVALVIPRGSGVAIIGGSGTWNVMSAPLDRSSLSIFHMAATTTPPSASSPPPRGLSAGSRPPSWCRLKTTA